MDPWIVAKVRCFNINNSDRPQSRQGVCTKHPPTQTRTRSSCQAWSSPSHTPPSSSHQADAFSSSKGCLNKANQLSSGPIGASHVQLACFTPEHFTFRCRQTQHAFVTRRSFLRMTARSLVSIAIKKKSHCSPPLTVAATAATHPSAQQTASASSVHHTGRWPHQGTVSACSVSSAMSVISNPAKSNLFFLFQLPDHVPHQLFRQVLILWHPIAYNVLQV